MIFIACLYVAETRHLRGDVRGKYSYENVHSKKSINRDNGERRKHKESLVVYRGGGGRHPRKNHYYFCFNFTRTQLFSSCSINNSYHLLKQDKRNAIFEPTKIRNIFVKDNFTFN